MPAVGLGARRVLLAPSGDPVVVHLVICGHPSLGLDCLRACLTSCAGVRQVAIGHELDQLVSDVRSERVDIVLMLPPPAGEVGLPRAEAIRACWPAAAVVMGRFDGSSKPVGAAQDRPIIRLKGSVQGLVRQLEDCCAAPDPIRPTVSGSAVAENDPLNGREVVVLKHLALGNSSRESAGLLGLSPRTVDGHRRSVSRKLGREGVAQLTRYAIASGLIDAAGGFSRSIESALRR